MKNQHNRTNGNERQQNVEVKDLQAKQDPKGGPHIRDFGRSNVQLSNIMKTKHDTAKSMINNVR